MKGGEWCLRQSNLQWTVIEEFVLLPEACVILCVSMYVCLIVQTESFSPSSYTYLMFRHVPYPLSLFVSVSLF